MSFLGNSVNPVSLDPLTSSINSKFDKTGPNILGPYRNKIINGNFGVWQRGTTQTLNGYGSADRWYNINNGTTKTASQQTFAAGQNIVPGDPTYFLRHVVTSSAGSANYCAVQQRIENVRLLSGGAATVTFWAQADSSRNIAIELVQSFGTGGSPSATVQSIGVTTFSLTTSWKKYTVVITIPSIAGMTLGTNNDHYLLLQFWFDAGSSFNSRTNSLGQQSGTFDIARISLVEGDATLESDPFDNRHIQQEVSLCQRYFQIITVQMAAYGTAGIALQTASMLPIPMRSVPTSSLINSGSLVNSSISLTVGSIYYVLQLTVTATGLSAAYTYVYGLDSEL